MTRGDAVFPNSMVSVPVIAAGTRVSIIMRTRDRPVMLARAFASVLSQTHQDWHLFVVNDGGATAGIDRLAAEYATAFDGRITVLHLAASRGMEAASNVALRALDGAAGGDFVCVHDDDDSWHPDFLACLSHFLSGPQGAGFAAVVCHCSVVREHIEDDCIIEVPQQAGLRPERIDYASMLRENQFAPISLMIRRSVVDTIGGFNEAMPVLGDWDYNLRILKVGDIGVWPALLARYHQRAPDEATSYGNTIGLRRREHESVRGLYGNSLLRALAQSDPACLALLHAVSGEAEANRRAQLEAIADSRAGLLSRSWDTESWDTARHADLRDRLLRVESELASMRATLASIRQVTDGLGGILARIHAWRARIGRWLQKAPKAGANRPRAARHAPMPPSATADSSNGTDVAITETVASTMPSSKAAAALS